MSQLQIINLLYRGTRDGFTPQIFHKKCDYQGKTLTFIKTTKGKIFGGYADMSWDSRGKSTLGKGESYLFGFTEDYTLVKCKCINVSVEMVCSKDHLIAFG